jgi:hypothetical protein
MWDGKLQRWHRWDYPVQTIPLYKRTPMFNQLQAPRLSHKTTSYVDAKCVVVKSMSFLQACRFITQAAMKQFGGLSVR